ncbi:MAG TPA: HAD family hydrolase [Christensenellaceae bacterium]|jgi:phosphoglycolate phosphatase|nr:HAD family hydrolase [Christensenellaceae bacterium]
MERIAIFDLDGTILNTLPDIAGSMNRSLEKIGLPQHDVEKYKLFTGNGSKVLTERALGDNIQYFDELHTLYREDYAKNSRRDTKPYDGIVNMIAALKNADCHILVYSNKDDSDVKSVMSYYLPQISHVAGKVEGFAPKPDTAGLINEINKLNIKKPYKIYYIGDTITDMQCAKNLGAISIAVTWGFQNKEMLLSENPDFFAQTPSDVVKIILGDIDEV